jgi:hypothetical protein
MEMILAMVIGLFRGDRDLSLSVGSTVRGDKEQGSKPFGRVGNSASFEQVAVMLMCYGTAWSG